MTPLIPVNRNGVVAYGYDIATQTLAVQYGSAMYHYFAVPADVARAVADAADNPDVNLMRFLNENVKGAYEYERQHEEPSTGQVDLGEPWSFPSRSGLG